MAEGKPIDVAVLGRVGIDLYPNQLRTPLREVRTYTRFVGGFAGNVATGLARLGLTPAIVSRVGPDPHGKFVRDFLSAEGVDVRFLAVDERLMTPPTFCEVWPPDRFPITFYRYPTAPDWQLAPQDFDGAEVAAAPFLLATGTGLAQSPSRETTLAALAEHQGTTIFDLDWRPALWERADEYGELARTAVGHADIVIGNEEEVAAAAGEPRVLLELGVRTLVLKRGERGALLSHDGHEVDVPGHPVEVVNGLGAGDAFVATFVQSLHAGLPVEEAVRRGSVAGAIVASQLACSEAMPTLQELEAELT
jgi:5-dehydro-2-deoxygluconokinase